VVREGFLLDPDIAYLNHGGYGACSREVFAEYQRLQAELERGPTNFFTRRLGDGQEETDEQPGLLPAARAALAGFVGARADDLVFARNATSALNAVIRSLGIRREEEVLTTAHEYGAIVNTWRFVAANLVVCPPDELTARIGPRTRAVFVSHITSPTALVLPVDEICAAARHAGVVSIVDGAHAPGQLPLDLTALGADVYAGDCHKWLGAPKGSGFLWARSEHQLWIAPLVISWGYRYGSDFAERHGWSGTLDLSSYLTVPKAIEMQASLDHGRCRVLADEAERRLVGLGLSRVEGVAAPFMRAFQLPLGDAPGLARRLYEEFRVEVPVYDWEGRRLLRVSIGPYNDAEDVDRLVRALEHLL
jgi:isopenicillin-N epimerase